MKIYITTHGSYEWNHISLCTTYFEFAIRHFIDYSKIDNYYNHMESFEVWEDNKQILDYGSLNYDIINQKHNTVTYDELKNEILERLNDIKR
jgi:hypothetical protein